MKTGGLYPITHSIGCCRLLPKNCGTQSTYSSTKHCWLSAYNGAFGWLWVRLTRRSTVELLGNVNVMFNNSITLSLKESQAIHLNMRYLPITKIINTTHKHIWLVLYKNIERTIDSGPSLSVDYGPNRLYAC